MASSIITPVIVTVTPAPSSTISTSLTGTAATSSASAAAKTLEAIISSAQAALSTESRIANGQSPTQDPPVYKFIGIALAVGSGILIGSSFVWKKKGLLSSQRKYNSAAGEGHNYLKSPLWWTGMIIMILGEVANFAAYMFAPAILVTPMGALSVVICAVLSHFILKESLTLFGSIGCFLCLVGSVIIALNGPEQHASGDIKAFQKMFLSVGFLIWMIASIITSLGLAFFVAPKYGKKNMLVYIGICSLIGGLSVSTTSGLGSAILLSIRGENQFKHWFIYILLAFVICTLLIEINYLNKALELFNTAMVTPTYYVLFTTCTLISSIVLFQGLQASASAILTIVLGFLVICSGITLLQLSKVDPDDLASKPGLDRRTTMLLKASQSHISHNPREKNDIADVEEPGLDTVRGGMGVVGSLLRARSSRRIASGVHPAGNGYHPDEMGSLPLNSSSGPHDDSHQQGAFGRPFTERYQLYDAPVGGGLDGRAATMPVRRGSHISFASSTAGGASGPASGGGVPGMYHNPSAASGLSVPGDPQSIILKDRARSQGGPQQIGGNDMGMGMRRYGTEPPMKHLGDIREASGESGGLYGYGPDPKSGFTHLTPASSNNSNLGPEVTQAGGRGGHYVDPFVRGGSGGGEDITVPVLLRGNGSGGNGGAAVSPSDIRSMWDQPHNESEKAGLESPTKESSGSGRRWGRRPGGGRREESGPHSNGSSDSEEERLLKQQRGTRSP
ncbi:hypothetical protein A4X09_0g2697 [Tilletia walkeri]|uniref:DUF803-domain-containing protein n=1 Tax=Tilletia walkeri TaxID=117179 RepID=A0A8X7NAE9_9BASI|nr:hypothetical protein A4X09_0g2697 [Tilletia walkeri]